MKLGEIEMEKNAFEDYVKILHSWEKIDGEYFRISFRILFNYHENYKHDENNILKCDFDETNFIVTYSTQLYFKRLFDDDDYKALVTEKSINALKKYVNLEKEMVLDNINNLYCRSKTHDDVIQHLRDFNKKNEDFRKVNETQLDELFDSEYKKIKKKIEAVFKENPGLTNIFPTEKVTGALFNKKIEDYIVEKLMYNDDIGEVIYNFYTYEKANFLERYRDRMNTLNDAS
jgi:hypothetical protein